MRTYFVPRVDLKMHILLITALCVIGGVGIAIKSHNTPLFESIFTASYVFAIMTAYYSVMIYHGVRYDNGYAKWKWDGIPVGEMVNKLSDRGIDIGNINIPAIDFGDNIFSSIVFFIITIIIASILLIIVFLLLCIGINIIGYSFIMIWIPMYVLIRYGMRLSLVNVCYSKGKLIKTLGISTFHGLISGIAMFTITYSFEWVVTKM